MEEKTLRWRIFTIEKRCRGKQGLEYGTVALTDLSHNGSSGNSVFRVNALTFSIITPKVFYRTPFIPAQPCS